MGKFFFATISIAMFKSGSKIRNESSFHLKPLGCLAAVASFKLPPPLFMCNVCYPFKDKLFHLSPYQIFVSPAVVFQYGQF